MVRAVRAHVCVYVCLCGVSGVREGSRACAHLARACVHGCVLVSSCAGFIDCLSLCACLLRVSKFILRRCEELTRAVSELEKSTRVMRPIWLDPSGSRAVTLTSKSVCPSSWCAMVPISTRSRNEDNDDTPSCSAPSTLAVPSSCCATRRLRRVVSSRSFASLRTTSTKVTRTVNSVAASLLEITPKIASPMRGARPRASDVVSGPKRVYVLPEPPSPTKWGVGAWAVEGEVGGGRRGWESDESTSLHFPSHDLD